MHPTEMTREQRLFLINLNNRLSEIEKQLKKETLDLIKTMDKRLSDCADWIKDYNKDDLYHRCQSLNCPIGMVTTVADLAASKQLEARGFFGEVDHPVMGNVKCPTAPYRFSQTPHRFHHPAPMLGEHNEEIFVNRLGYSREDLARMRGTGVI